MSNATHLAKRAARSAEPVQYHDTVAPPVDVYENGDELLVVADVPGASHDGIDVQLEKGELTILAKRVGETTVEIVDNGRGLAVSAKAPGSPPGHGLVGMRERVALFGGTLETGPRVGGGFRVFARLRWTDTADRPTRSMADHQ